MREVPLKSGIYSITNTVNNKLYIGSAVDLTRRWNKHKRYLNKNIHPNKYLQASWNKHGEKNFQFKVLQYVENVKNIIAIEQSWLDWFKSFERGVGYNICRIADNRLGVLHTEESKLKMSYSRKGIIKSVEWQNKITKALIGKKRTKEQRERQSLSLKGRKLSDATREKMRLSQTGRKHSEESKLKRSLALKGKPRKSK